MIARKEYEERRGQALRLELSRTVRSISPVLKALLVTEGISDLPERVFAAVGWPARPRFNDALLPAKPYHPHLLRHSLAVGSAATPGTGNGFSFAVSGGGRADVVIYGHSVEVRAKLGDVTIETRFGDLMLRIAGGLPQAVAIGCVGRPLEDVVFHPAFARRGWIIEAFEDWHDGMVFIVPTGNLPWRFPEAL